MEEIKKYIEFKSKIGTMFIGGTSSEVTHITWTRPSFSKLKKETEFEILHKCRNELSEFLDGSRKSFSIPIVVQGTDFQESVWNELQKIPYGATISYKELALRVNNPKAMQAVGSANGKNPISIIIPCHRVIACDGKLSGYAGGVDKKEKLLRLEGAII